MITKEFTIQKTYEVTDEEIEDIRDDVFSWMGIEATKGQVILFSKIKLPVMIAVDAATGD